MKKVNQIVLLDIDGVIVPFDDNFYETPGPDQYHHFLNTVSFNPECVRYVVELITRTDSKVILISSWRRFFRAHKDELKAALVRGGIPVKVFHSSWFAPFKFSSKKIDDLMYVIKALNAVGTSDNTVIRLIDDDEMSTQVLNGINADYKRFSIAQITPKAEIGFTEADLRIALAFNG